MEMGELSTPLSDSSYVVISETNSLRQRRFESMEERLGRVELQLVRLVEQNLAAPEFELGETSTSSFLTHQDSTALGQYQVDIENVISDEMSHMTNRPQSGLIQSPRESQSGALDISARILNQNPVNTACSSVLLPPIAEIQPTIDHYFSHTNSLIPLFSQRRFNIILQGYYASTCQQPEVTWAAINVVLGLATYLPVLPSNNVDTGVGGTEVAKYIRNVRKVLPDLLLREGNLLVLQVVLGLVILNQGLKDSQGAVMLIGIAVRLAQRLRLHSQDAQYQYSSEERVERERVFWITYLYDKDISQRHHTPSAQDDADVDVTLPADNPLDDGGTVYAIDGLVCFNFFRHRLHLAHIQGQVYDLLFSNGSTRISSQERKRRIAVLDNQLEQWRLSTPPAFQAENVAETVGRTALLWICTMHFSYLSCLVMVHGIWSHDAEWRKRLTTRPLDVSFSGEILDRSKFGPPLPPGWRNCVKMSRSCMSLISRIALSDSNLWANGCAYFSALLILEANIIEYPLNHLVDLDLQLTGFAVNVLDKMSWVSSVLAMKRMNIVAAELDRQSRFVVNKAQRALAAGQSISLVDDPGAATTEKMTSTGTPLRYFDTIKWTWGKDGVEAWPEMDFTITHDD